MTQDGKLYASGDATNGRLGLGVSSGHVSVPRQLTALSQYVIKKVAVHSGGCGGVVWWFLGGSYDAVVVMWLCWWCGCVKVSSVAVVVLMGVMVVMVFYATMVASIVTAAIELVIEIFE